MKTRKTPATKRSSYIYRSCTGERFELVPGRDGVTEADIRLLHSLDDAEVRNNLKNLNTGEERTISLQGIYEDEDRDIQMETATYDYEENPAVDRLREVMNDLTNRQRGIIEMVDLEGLSEAEVGRMLGTSRQNVCQIRKMALLTIKSQYVNIW